MLSPIVHQADENNDRCTLCGFRLGQTATCHESRLRYQRDQFDKELGRIKGALAVISRYMPKEGKEGNNG